MMTVDALLPDPMSQRLEQQTISDFGEQRTAYKGYRGATSGAA
jgi:hypothetical protein